MQRSFHSRRVALRTDDGLCIKAARVDTRGGRIEAVDTVTPEETPSGYALVELGDKLLTPAFVNAHSHLALCFLRGVAQAAAQKSRNVVEDLFFHVESLLSAEDVRAFSRMGAYESLLAGVGMVWDHYYHGQAVADALLDTGLSGVVAPTLQDLSGPGQGMWERAQETTLRIAEDASLAARGVSAAWGPHATDTVSPHMLRQVAELAEQHELPVHLHLAQSYAELRRIETREGRSPLSLLSREGLLERAPHLLMAHAMFVPDTDLRLLNAHQHTLVYCPSAQARFAFPAPMPRWCGLGLDWVVATDCAASNDSMNLQKELRLCAGAAATATTGGVAYTQFLKHGRHEDAHGAWEQHKTQVAQLEPHVGAEALLARVWHKPGALHPRVKAGSIEAGAVASFAVWNTEHPAFWPGHDPLHTLAFGDTTGALHALFVRGEAVGEVGNVAGGLLSSKAYADARTEADARLAELLKRAKLPR